MREGYNAHLPYTTSAIIVRQQVGQRVQAQAGNKLFDTIRTSARDIAVTSIAITHTVTTVSSIIITGTHRGTMCVALNVKRSTSSAHHQKVGVWKH